MVLSLKAAAEDLSSNKSFLVMWHCRKVICLVVLLDSALVCPIPCKHAVGILICLEIYETSSELNSAGS